MAYVGVLSFLPGSFEKSLPGLKSPYHQNQSRCQLFFFSHAPVLYVMEATCLEYLSPGAYQSQEHLQGEFGNSAGRNFSWWVRPKVSLYPCLPSLPPACWVGMFLNLPAGQRIKPANLAQCVPWQLCFQYICVYLHLLSVHPSEGSVAECVWYWILHLIQFTRHFMCNRPLQGRRQRLGLHIFRLTV